MINKLMLTLSGVLLAATVWAADLLNPEVLNQQDPNRYTIWDLVLSGQDKPWFAYYGADNKLYVRRPGGDEIGLGATDRATDQSGLAMVQSGANGVALFWRDKLPSKTLFLIPKLEPTGDVPTPIVVGGDESAPLPALKMAQDEKGTYLLWLGEKVDPQSNEKYHLYFRTVEPDGKTLSPVEQVLPGLYPAWIVDEKVIPIFSWTERQEQRAMMMRVFDRDKKSFGPPVKIADAPPISPLFEAFKSGQRWFLVWLGIYGENQLLFEGAYSDDQGQTWKRFAFEELRGFNQGGIDVVTDHQGHILITLDGNWRFTNPDDTKNNVYLIRSSDNGATWQKPQTVRPEEYRPTKGQYPMLALGTEPGTVMLAWEDWRDIRSNVYVSYSRDYGATWEPALPLGRPGVWNLGLNPQARVFLSGSDGRFQLLARQYQNTSAQGSQDLVLYTFNWEELKKSAAAFTQPQGTEERLRERIAAYWQAMIDRDYETSYAFMDPFFRDARPLTKYRSAMGVVHYHSYQVGKMARKGNIAKVRVKVESSVPEFTAPSGKKVSQPLKSVSFVDTWIFVNDDWYREHYDRVSEASFTRY
jgi:hypothetical protein